MPKKGKEKNTNNKAKHTRLIKQKEKKIKLKKIQNKERLKILIRKINNQKEEE